MADGQKGKPDREPDGGIARRQADPGKELRRNQGTLGICGMAVIAFGIWSVVKSVMAGLLSTAGLSELADEQVLSMTAMRVIYYVMIFLIVGADLLFRLYIGKSARAVSRGRKRNVLYLILAGLLATSFLFIFGLEVYNLVAVHESVTTTVASILVDVTSLICLIQLIRSGIQVRRLQRREATASEG